MNLEKLQKSFYDLDAKVEKQKKKLFKLQNKRNIAYRKYEKAYKYEHSEKFINFYNKYIKSRTALSGSMIKL